MSGSGIHPIADRIVRVAAPMVLRRIRLSARDLAEAAASLEALGPGKHAALLMISLCTLHKGVPELRRLAAIVADAGRMADPRRLVALEKEIGGMVGWTVGAERAVA